MSRGPLLVLLCVCLAGVATAVHPKHVRYFEKVASLEKNMEFMARQLMMQQFYAEEQVRSDGDSGLKRVRIRSQGTQPYHSANHADSDTVAAIHNHPDHAKMLGLGEIVAVLNGVEFRTHHNDYHLRSRHPTDRRHGKFADIAFPDVPDEVTRLPEVEDQIAEMREWFKAWRDENPQPRNYEKYFKPVMCYLEGMWTKDQERDKINSHFPKDPHQINAKTWEQLSEKVRFTSYAGSHDVEENIPYLPTSVIKIEDGTHPILVQWNFGIYCHPLKDYMPVSYMRAVDDLKSRMTLGGISMKEYEATRTARYQMPVLKPDQDKEFREAVGKDANYLDRLMMQIPGPDNYLAVLNDTMFGQTVYDLFDKSETPMNVARYHRWLNVQKPDDFGRKLRHRSFSDESVFMAQTTDPRVAGIEAEVCHRLGKDETETKECSKWFQKWTYAIPLEIVYLTPLHKWNPYKILDRGSYTSSAGKQVTAGNRYGASVKAASRGVNDRFYYLTPKEFFNDEADLDSADTGTGSRWVRKAKRQTHEMRASGVWVHLPDIPGVGKLRTRFPIMPIHGQGSGVWKELEGFKDMVLNPNKNKDMFPEDITLCNTGCD